MKIDFQRLVEIDCVHRWLSSDPQPVVSFFPTAATERWMRSRQLLARTLGNDLVVAYETELEGAVAVPQRPFTATDRLQFAIQWRDARLGPMSDIDPPVDTLFYLSNRATSTASGGRERLHPETVLTEAQSILLRPKVFHHARTSELEAMLHNEAGDLIAILSPLNLEGLNVYAVDLEEFPDGLYTLSEPDASPVLCWSDNTLWRSRPWALVDLSFDPSLATEARLLDDDGAPQHRAFRIEVNTRATPWRYDVHPRRDTSAAPGNLELVDAQGRFGFGAGSVTTGPTGESVIRFESNTDIPLTSTGYRDLQLLRQVGADRYPLIQHLPSPGFGQVVYDRTEARFYSSLSIYI